MANTSSSNKRNAAGNDHILTISPYWLPEQIFSDEENSADDNATRTFSSKRSESGSRTGGNTVQAEPDLNVCFFRELIKQSW
jgi:hypothetical protein